MATPYRVSLCALVALATRHVDLALTFPEPRDWRLRVLTFLLGRTQQVDTVYEPSFPDLVNALLLALGPSLGNWIAQVGAACLPPVFERRCCAPPHSPPLSNRTSPPW